MNLKIIIVSILVLVIIAGLSYFLLSSKKMTPNTNTTTPTSIPTPTETVPTQPTLTDNPTEMVKPSATPTESGQKETLATIQTSKGNIVVSFYRDAAPKTVANFISKAKSDYYKNLTFHRVENWVIQGGDPIGNGTGGGTMTTEINDKPFVIGSVGIARGGNIEISNDSQFFITKTDAQWLNSQYTNFGIVTSGMDVVNKIEIGDKILQVTLSD